jgi:hypothetical protein
MLREFTEETWVSEEGIFRIDTMTETNEKMFIQVFKSVEEGAYASAGEQEVIIMRKDSTITLATRNPFIGYLLAKIL